MINRITIELIISLLLWTRNQKSNCQFVFKTNKHELIITKLEFNTYYDLKLKTFDLKLHKMFHTSEFSDDPSSFISKNETISVLDLWYTWPESRLVDSWQFVAAPVIVERRLVDFNAGFNVNCLFDSSFKLAGVLCPVFQVAWRLSLNVIWYFRAGGTVKVTCIKGHDLTSFSLT